MKDYSIGDEVWFIPFGHCLVIKSKIVDIDDYFRKINSNAYLFYWLDEPVGHGVGNDELFLSKENAILHLKKIIQEDEYHIEKLERYRKRTIDFILSTHNLEKEKLIDISIDWYKSLSEKIKGVDWFNKEDIINV